MTTTNSTIYTPPTTVDQLSTTQFPHELFRPIFEYLKHDRNSLCSIAQSSRTCGQEAQRILFRNITSLNGNGKHLEFLRAIIASPNRLALHVRSYRREYCNDYILKEDEDLIEATQNAGEELDILFYTMHSALNTMCNLRSLYLDLEQMDSEGFGGLGGVDWLLRECTFGLERLDLKGKLGLGTRELFQVILLRQRGLKHLGLWDLPTSSARLLQPVVSTICLDLVSLVADWNTAVSLIEGRTNVTTLTVVANSYDDARSTDVRILVPKFNHIKCLSYRRQVYKENPSMDLDFILRHFPSLRVLELLICNQDEDLRFLQRIPELHTLIIPRPLEQEEIRHIFDNASKNLQFIQLKPPYVSKEVDYLCYTRSQEGAQIMGVNEVRKWWLYVE